MTSASSPLRNLKLGEEVSSTSESPEGSPMRSSPPSPAQSMKPTPMELDKPSPSPPERSMKSASSDESMLPPPAQSPSERFMKSASPEDGSISLSSGRPSPGRSMWSASPEDEPMLFSPPRPSVSPLSPVQAPGFLLSHAGHSEMELDVNVDPNDHPMAEYFLSEFHYMRSTYKYRKEFPSFFLWAARFGHYDAVKTLIQQAEADISECNTTPSGKNRTCLHYAARYGYKNILSLLLPLLEDNDIDIDYVRDIYGFTALHLASIDPVHDIIKMLIERGTDLNILTNAGDMALHIAVKKGDDDIIDLFVENGADLSAKNAAGYTPLMIAAELGNDLAILKLAENELDLDWQATFSGDTALHLAAKKGHLDAFKYILRMGANYRLTNFLSKTVVDYKIEDLPKLKEKSNRKIMVIIDALAENRPNSRDLINAEEGEKPKPIVSTFSTKGIPRYRGRKRSFDEWNNDENQWNNGGDE